MKRRDFVTGLGAAALPLTAYAQQAVPVVGFLHSSLPLVKAAHLVNAFRHGLKEAGFIEGRNVTVEYHSAEGQDDRLHALLADLILRRVAVIAGNTIAMLAAKKATTTVPIVFAGGTDSVKTGLVASLNHPGGNVTGASFFAGVLGAKRLALLRQLVPDATTIAMLVNPHSSETEAERSDVEAAAQAVGQQLVMVDAVTVRDIEPAFATFVQRGAGALLCGSGPFLISNRDRMVGLAARHRLPASYSLREYVDAGGLMSYGTSISDAYERAGVYVGRILNGDKPANLPVIQSRKFELVINLKAARALGLQVSPTLLATADEVIE